MRIVGIDTASAVASVAVIEDEKLLAERFHPSSAAGSLTGVKSNHAENLLPLVDSTLAMARISLAEVAGIAVSIGPGSFTGLRVGLSTVKGLAYGWGVPVAGISTLLAQAARVGDFDGVICALLDAGKNEVYAALFRKSNHALTRMTEDCLAAAEDVILRFGALIGDDSCLFIGDAIRRYERKLLDLLGSATRLCAGESLPSRAAAVARLGSERLRNSDGDDLGKLVPVYLRRPHAEAKRSSRT